jgi:hypothetical protein
VTDDMVCDALSSSGSDTAKLWGMVWNVLASVDTVDVDKQLMNNLRDIKTVVTSDVLNMGCQLVINNLQDRAGGAAIVRKLEQHSGRLRSMLKTIMQIGANLSQSKEYRDFFEDVLTKLAEPLEDANLSLAEMNIFIMSTAALVRAIPEAHRISALTHQAGQTSYKKDSFDRRKDWARFIFCVRLVLVELVEGSA